MDDQAFLIQQAGIALNVVAMLKDKNPSTDAKLVNLLDTAVEHLTGFLTNSKTCG